MFNIYDYFYSTEVANHFKSIFHNFTDEEMVYIIYKSNKPLSFKIKGLKYIRYTCIDPKLIKDIDIILEEYNEVYKTLESDGEDAYYKVEFEDEKYINIPVFKTYNDVKKYVDQERKRKEAELKKAEAYCVDKRKYKVTKYEFFDKKFGYVEYGYIFNQNDEILSVRFRGEKLSFPKDCEIMPYLYVETPIIYENNGMRIVDIYDPDFTIQRESYLLSKNQTQFNETRTADRLLYVLEDKDYYNSKLTGPLADDVFVNEQGNYERSYKCINEFMNMYFVSDEEINTEEHKKLQVLRKIIKEL